MRSRGKKRRMDDIYRARASVKTPSFLPDRQKQLAAVNASPFTFRGISTQHLPRKTAWKGVACYRWRCFQRTPEKKTRKNTRSMPCRGRASLSPNEARSLLRIHARTPRIKRESRSRAGRHSLEMMLRLLPPQVRQLCVQQRGFELVEDFLETLRAFRGGGGGFVRTAEWGETQQQPTERGGLRRLQKRYVHKRRKLRAASLRRPLAPPCPPMLTNNRALQPPLSFRIDAAQGRELR